jgi:uncharacterized Zn finger protein (UPF0148 family)
MKKHEILCSSCGNDYMIVTYTLDDEIEYCPICGELISVESEDDDEEWEE